MTFGTLSAVDERGPDDAAGDPDAGRTACSTSRRAQYSLGPSNYVGALVTDTSFAAAAQSRRRRRPVVAPDADAAPRGVRARVADARDTRDGDAALGVGAQVNYSYETQKWCASGSAEHYDRDFQMDTAFINRVGITSGWALRRAQLLSGQDAVSVAPPRARSSFTQGGRDRIAGGGDLLAVAGVRFNFTRQGFLRVDRIDRLRALGRPALRARPAARVRQRAAVPLAGPRRRTVSAGARSSTIRSIRSRAARATFGVGIDAAAERPACRRSCRYERVAFDRASTGERVYTIDIVNTRTTYQFTRALLAARHRPVRQLAQPRAHRFPVVVRAAPRHRRLCRLRLADRAARLRRGRSGSQARDLSDDAARPVLQGVVSAIASEQPTPS